MQYKHKIIVFEIPDYSYHGNRNFNTILLCSKEILRKMKFAKGKYEIYTFSDWLSFDNINY